MTFREKSRILIVWLLQPVALLFCSFFLSPCSSPVAQTTRTSNENNLTVAEVLSNVRKAINHDQLKRLNRGFVLEEFEAKSNESSGRVLTFGSSGEFREDSIPRGDRPFGFDGKYAWQPDRTGFPTPVPQRLREKLLIPAWVRGGWWLDKNAPFIFSTLPEATNEKQVALSMKLERGLVGAKIFIDRETWLPKTLIVEYERKGSASDSRNARASTIVALIPNLESNQLREYRKPPTTHLSLPLRPTIRLSTIIFRRS
jgi:hypothetical protein